MTTQIDIPEKKVTDAEPRVQTQSKTNTRTPERARYSERVIHVAQKPAPGSQSTNLTSRAVPIVASRRPSARYFRACRPQSRLNGKLSDTSLRRSGDALLGAAETVSGEASSEEPHVFLRQISQVSFAQQNSNGTTVKSGVNNDSNRLLSRNTSDVNERFYEKVNVAPS